MGWGEAKGPVEPALRMPPTPAMDTMAAQAAEIARLRAAFSRTDRQLGVDQQRLFMCRWGTMCALVWAMTPENAELRVRHDVFDRRASLHKVCRYPIIRHEEMLVREATDEDRDLFFECGIDVPA